MRTSVVGSLVLAVAGMSACISVPTPDPVAEVVWLDQGWNVEDRQRFHHITQGTMTLPIPYEWFAALEQPETSFLSTPGMFTEEAYLRRFGFIPSPVSRFNPAGLPVGFAVDYRVQNPAIADGEFNAIGLTCAACHTGQMTYQGTSIRYDGGPAMTDLVLFTEALAASLVETYLEGSRFDRFAARVLGATNTQSHQAELRVALEKSLKNLLLQVIEPIENEARELRAALSEAKLTRPKKVFRAARKVIRDNRATDEGFTRLDALNRIGNSVFASDTDRDSNLAVIDAPVNYPHIWNASWFLWVQYDASIMQPMVRNSGEALGVSAHVVLDQRSPKAFSSSIPLRNLFWIESQLAGASPTKAGRFSGLEHPRWPAEILGPIDVERHRAGAELYRELCQSCHLPPIDSKEFWSERFWTPASGEGRQYLDLPIVDVGYVGTDPQQARVLSKRTVDTTGIGLDTRIWVEKTDWFSKGPVYTGAEKSISSTCEPVQVEDAKSQSYALALGAVVQEVNNAWYRANGTPPAEQQIMNGNRPNCLRAPAAYKARPLNGIWATAPFLHNGSVPTIYDLLSPLEERPVEFYLGSQEYDPTRLGYRSEKASGYFKLDTRVRGNSNSGHEFADVERSGVIGRRLSEDERWALVEFLKDPTSGPRTRPRELTSSSVKGRATR